jgi:hypothetical protein
MKNCMIQIIRLEKTKEGRKNCELKAEKMTNDK